MPQVGAARRPAVLRVYAVLHHTMYSGGDASRYVLVQLRVTLCTRVVMRHTMYWCSITSHDALMQ